MIYIYFIYGVSFFTLGLAILLYPKNGSIFKLASNVWLIGVFGIIHGVNEWIDMFVFIEKGSIYAVKMVEFVILPLSFVFLLYFGLITLKERIKVLNRVVIWAIIGGLSLLFLVISLRSSDPFLAGNIGARYLLGFPGILLTALALLSQLKYFKNPILLHFKNKLIFLALTFLLYGFFSGIIVPGGTFFPASFLNYSHFEQFIGVPVQVFRALCALSAAYFSVVLLKVFRHETENKLLKLSSAIEMSGDSVVITDRNGIIEYVNPAFERQTGFTLLEAIAKKANLQRSGKHTDEFYKNLWQTILSGDTYRGCLINKKKSGELYHEEKAIAPIRDEYGNITSFISTGKDITEHVVMEERLKDLASTDKLTGIANRLKFDEYLQYSIKKAQKEKIELCVILFDIDDFKKVNDNYGHIKGDYVLQKIASISNRAMRQSDLLARWGGEEFIVLQLNTGLQEAKTLAERLRKEIAEFSFEGVGHVTVTFGVTCLKKGDTVKSFLVRADKALYEAKAKGKNCVVAQ